MTYRRRGAAPVPLLTAGQASIRALLAGNPTRLQLMMRHTSVHRLCCDIAEHVRWPALEASLRADVERLRERLESR